MISTVYLVLSIVTVWLFESDNSFGEIAFIEDIDENPKFNTVRAIANNFKCFL